MPEVRRGHSSSSYPGAFTTSQKNGSQGDEQGDLQQGDLHAESSEQRARPSGESPNVLYFARGKVNGFGKGARAEISRPMAENPDTT